MSSLVEVSLRVHPEVVEWISKNDHSHVSQCCDLLPWISQSLSMQVMMCTKDQSNEKMMSEYEKQIVRLKTMHLTEMEDLLKKLEDCDSTTERAVAKTTQVHEAAKKDLLEIMSKKDQQVDDLTAILRGSNTRTGVCGEVQVAEVFNDLNVGFLEDTRHSQELGAEDFIYTFDDNAKEYRVSVEVKKSAHTIKREVMVKHETRIKEAVGISKIDGGLFLSLDCRIPNKPVLSVSTDLGVPIVYVSRCDGLSSKALIEIGFILVKQVIPMISTNESESDDEYGEKNNQIIQQFTTIFNKQISGFIELNNECDGLEKQATAMVRTVERLKKTKKIMLDSLLSLESAYPDLFLNNRSEPSSIRGNNEEGSSSDNNNAEHVPDIMTVQLSDSCKDLSDVEVMVIRKLIKEKLNDYEKRWSQMGKSTLCAAERIAFDSKKQDLLSLAQAESKRLKKILPAQASQKKIMSV